MGDISLPETGPNRTPEQLPVYLPFHSIPQQNLSHLPASQMPCCSSDRPSTATFTKPLLCLCPTLWATPTIPVLHALSGCRHLGRFWCWQAIRCKGELMVNKIAFLPLRPPNSAQQQSGVFNPISVLLKFLKVALRTSQALPCGTYYKSLAMAFSVSINIWAHLLMAGMGLETSGAGGRRSPETPELILIGSKL